MSKYNFNKVYYYLGCISLLYFFFINYFELIIGSGLTGMIYIVTIIVVVILCAAITHKFTIRISIPWLVALLVMLYSSREKILAGNLYWVIIYVANTLLLCFLSLNVQWVGRIAKPIKCFGNIHVLSTIILFIFSPELYNATFRHIWGGAPGGVTLDEAYKAGITMHYSTNGIYCALIVLLYASIILARGVDASKRKNHSILFLVTGIFAILLTTKRAHLLFSAFAIIVIYYFSTNTNKTRKVFNILAVTVTVLIFCVLLSPIIPVIGAIMERFLGTEDISNGRFAYWQQAWDCFLDNKLFGIGWGEYFKINKHGTSVHNVYIQLLCESGIVGFCVFVYAMVKTYIVSIKNYRKYNTRMMVKYKEMMLFSIAVQTFYLVYSFTGNCLYDMNVIFYYLVCAMAFSIFRAIEKEPHKVLVKINE